MTSLFLPFAQVIASEERDEKLSPCVLLGSRKSQEKRGLGFSFFVAENWK